MNADVRYGRKQTWVSALLMSAFEGKARYIYFLFLLERHIVCATFDSDTAFAARCGLPHRRGAHARGRGASGIHVHGMGPSRRAPDITLILRALSSAARCWFLV